MKTTGPLIAALFANAAAAESDFSYVGAFRAGIDNDAVFQTTPALESTSVNFTTFFNNIETSWLWTVDVQNVSVPNNIEDLGRPNANYSEDLNLANTQWHLRWQSPNNQNLQQYVLANNVSVVFNALLLNVPENITSKYNPMDNGNCTSLLGSQCVQSIQNAAASTSQSTGFADLAGCQNSLRFQGSGLFQELSVNFDGNGSFTAAAGNDSLLYVTSPQFAAGNSTQIKYAESALHLLAVDFKYHTPNRGYAGGPAVVCRIIDTKAEVGTAKDWRPSMSMVWGVAMVAALMIFQ